MIKHKRFYSAILLLCCAFFLFDAVQPAEALGPLLGTVLPFVGGWIAQAWSSGALASLAVHAAAIGGLFWYGYDRTNAGQKTTDPTGAPIASGEEVVWVDLADFGQKMADEKAAKLSDAQNNGALPPSPPPAGSPLYYDGPYEQWSTSCGSTPEGGSNWSADNGDNKWWCYGSNAVAPYSRGTGIDQSLPCVARPLNKCDAAEQVASVDNYQSHVDDYMLDNWATPESEKPLGGGGFADDLADAVAASPATGFGTSGPPGGGGSGAGTTAGVNGGDITEHKTAGDAKDQLDGSMGGGVVPPGGGGAGLTPNDVKQAVKDAEKENDAEKTAPGTSDGSGAVRPREKSFSTIFSTFYDSAKTAPIVGFADKLVWSPGGGSCDWTAPAATSFGSFDFGFEAWNVSPLITIMKFVIIGGAFIGAYYIIIGAGR